MPKKPPDFLVHNLGDSVGVIVRNVSAGPVQGGYLDADDVAQVTLPAAVGLGHKIALTHIPEGGDVIEYGVRIGVATQDIHVGDHVHVHNLRSARWQTSVA